MVEAVLQSDLTLALSVVLSLAATALAILRDTARRARPPAGTAPTLIA